MTKLPQNIVTFSQQTNGDTMFFEQALDYYAHYAKERYNENVGVYDTSVSLAAKEDQIHECFCNEIQRISGQDMGHFDTTVMSTNPVVTWAALNIISHVIDAIIPNTIIDSTKDYLTLDYVDWGDSRSYDVEPNFLFTVSQGANAQRVSFVQKQFRTTRTLMPVNHVITVQASLYKVLTHKESLGEFIRKAVISMNTAMTLDAYNALRTGLNAATVPTALTVDGYTEDSLLELCMTVEAYNHGAKPTILGTALAIKQILPNGADGYRIMTPSDNMSIQVIKNFFNYNIVVLPQVATGNIDYSLALNNNEIYVVSSTSDKLVRGVIEGSTLSNSNDYYDNANLTSNFTMNKRWDIQWLSNAVAGIVKLA